jgi:N-acetyltransferase
VRDIVDRDLGFVSSDDSAPRTAYLYIVNKRVVGMATAEVIQHAFVSQNSLERSLEPRKVMTGVHQLWVHAKFRKQGVATRLVDAVRAKFVFGLTVPKEMLAFSSPTEAGSCFARNYVCGDSSKETKEILVYDCV